MKVLSLKQPWAEFVADGKKTIELRTWNTKFRGEFLIHASKSPDMNAMKKFGFSENALPRGVILGKASLVDVKKYENEDEFSKDANLHLATSDWGEYGFVLDKISKLDRPIPALGKLNFWDFELKL